VVNPSGVIKKIFLKIIMRVPYMQEIGILYYIIYKSQKKQGKRWSSHDWTNQTFPMVLQKVVT